MRGGACDSLNREKSDLLVSCLRARAADESKLKLESDPEDPVLVLDGPDDDEREPLADEPEEYLLPELAP